jgi:predicted esterase
MALGAPLVLKVLLVAIAATTSSVCMLLRGGSGTPSPSHLIFLVHGLGGKTADLLPLRAAFEGRGGGRSHVVVHIASANDSTQRIALDRGSSPSTFDGVVAGSSRLAQEFREVVKSYPSLRRVSLIGNSLGGIYVRHMASLLYDKRSGTLAGLQPACLVTIATPHLGVRSHTFLPIGPAWTVAATALGKTGVDLFLADANRTQGEQPLLVKMATDNHFLEPLRAFRSRRVYANLRGDLLVPCSTAAIGPHNESERAVEEQPFEGGGMLRTYEALGSDSNLRSGTHDAHQHAMIKGLASLGWSKVVVDFGQPVTVLNHNRIAAMSRNPVEGFLYRRGRSVVEHVADFCSSH